MLTQQQVNDYFDQGYIVVPDVIDAATRKTMLGVIDQWVDGAKGLTSHNDKYDLEPIHSPENPRVRRVKKPHTHHPLFWDWLRSEPLIGIMQQLLGPNIRLHGSKLNIKAPRYGSPVEWHQDWAFYPHTNDDVLAVGVYLEDVTVENGCMMVIPGTHKQGVWDHHAEGRFCGAMEANCGIDFSQAVPCVGKAGSVSIHHVRLVHGSAQNFSNSPRPLLLYELTAADAWPLVNWTNLDEFNGRMVVGQPTLEPRFEKVPVRMPYPPALNQGSIYENQTAIKHRFFEMRQAAT